MALDSCVFATGAKQGKFAGQNQVKGRTGSTVVTRFEAGAEAPRDAHTGLGIGKREYKPCTFECPADSSVINWQTALATNETLNTVTFNFYQSVTQGLTQGTAAGAGGESKPFYTIELKNAVVSKVEFFQPYSRAVDPEVKNKDIHFRVSLTFMEITCTWVEGGKTFNDNWLAPT